MAWVVCSILGKTYRSQIRWGTLIAAPLALTSLLFVPEYWTPPSLFNLDQRIRVGIEDFLWAAAVGGIASVVGELFLRERLGAIRKSRHKRHYAPFVLVVVVFVALYFGLPFAAVTGKRLLRWTSSLFRRSPSARSIAFSSSVTTVGVSRTSISQSIRQAHGSSSSCEKHFHLDPLRGSSSLIVMPSMDWKSPQRFDP